MLITACEQNVGGGELRRRFALDRFLFCNLIEVRNLKLPTHTQTGRSTSQAINVVAAANAAAICDNN